MRVKIIKNSRNELKIEVRGEGHTFCNVLQKALLKDNRVELSGYNLPHPLTSNPVIYVRTKGQSKTKAVLKEAIKDVTETQNINGYNNFILEEFKALRKSYKHGIPPSGTVKKSKSYIEVNPYHIVDLKYNNIIFKIIPVQRLRAVIVNTGYRREVNTEHLSKLVDISFTDENNQKWYPGVEAFGEGFLVFFFEVFF